MVMETRLVRRKLVLTCHSLRQMLGTVPQSPMLFNDTVMSNISYANRMASEEEVFEACRAACIHDKILTFSDGYETRVGERGVYVSPSPRFSLGAVS
jgi:ABC-type multidrug transport system fused ATPase/permease subunit